MAIRINILRLLCKHRNLEVCRLNIYISECSHSRVP